MTTRWMVALSLMIALVASGSLWAQETAEDNTVEEGAITQAGYESALEAWQRTLQRFVDEQGRTDFIALADDLDDLKVFVEFVGAASPKSHPDLFPNREDVLAYHANAYNALAMMGVIERKIPSNFSSFFKRASFFKFRSVVIGGKKTNLYDYENKVIRPLDEPRMHFVLNCMVRDCPRLPMDIFTAEQLEQQLESATLEFFASEQHLRIDAEKRVVRVSSILKFYTKDFVESGKAKDVGTYISRYIDDDVSDGYDIKFIKYDWTINQRPRA